MSSELQEKKGIDIALCSDRNMLPGLHVTLYSTLHSLDREVIPTFHLFQQGMSSEDMKALERTLEKVGKPFEFRVRPAEIDAFKQFRSLRGNHMAYLRLALPYLLPEVSTVLYLDSDLLVIADLNDLFEEGLDGASAGFPYDGGRKGLSLDREFFRSMGYDLESAYFNSGVVLFDLDQWREQDLADEAMQILETYDERLSSHDQSILNVMYHERPVKTFDIRYNVQMFSDKPKREWNEGVLHFIGGPKPWDLGGEFVNVHGRRFVEWLDRTSYAGWRSYRNPSLHALKMAVRHSKTYVRCIKAQLAGTN